MNAKKKMMMEAANGSTSELPDCVEMLEMDVEGLKTWAHAFIVPLAPYQLLLEHPWQHLVHLKQEETEDSMLITIHDPCNSSNICTCNTTGQSPFPHMTSLAAMVTLTLEKFYLQSQISVVNDLTAKKLLSEYYKLDPVKWVLAYKKVANKVKPVPTTMPSVAHIHQKFPEDPMDSLPELTLWPPEFFPRICLT